MQTANILLSLGGDHGNTVSKFNCTASEIAVLREIHGADAVKEIEPVGDVKRSHREERIRLLNIYGHAKTEDRSPIVEGLFPGAAARVFEDLSEIGLDDSYFKATERLKANSVARPVRDDGPTIAVWIKQGYAASHYPPSGYTSKSTPEEIAAAVAAETPEAVDAPAHDEDDEPDGIDDIDDGHGETSDILG